MQKEDVLNSLREELPIIKELFGVKSIGLFGSYARGLQNEESDIDLLIDLKEINYNSLHSTFIFIEKKFPGKKIQLTRKGPHLSENFLATIEKGLIYV